MRLFRGGPCTRLNPTSIYAIVIALLALASGAGAIVRRRDELDARFVESTSCFHDSFWARRKKMPGRWEAGQQRRHQVPAEDSVS
jgi:hypothetical protein